MVLRKKLLLRSSNVCGQRSSKSHRADQRKCSFFVVSVHVIHRGLIKELFSSSGAYKSLNVKRKQTEYGREISVWKIWYFEGGGGGRGRAFIIVTSARYEGYLRGSSLE